MEAEQKPKVVVVGGGFGGIALAKKLSGKPFQVLLIDKHNYHTFQPLLYQVATGGLEPDSIAYPIRRIFRKKKNIAFRMAEVQRVYPEESKLETSIGPIDYDKLIIATGSTNNFLSFDQERHNLLPLKSVPEALDMRSCLMQNLEKAILFHDQRSQPQINIVIVGGGPAGVELAGALAEMKKYVLPRDFPELDLKNMAIYLLEAAPKLLSSMSAKSSEAAKGYLTSMGVIVKLNSGVKGIDEDKVLLNTGSFIDSNTVIWTAGVKPFPIQGLPDSTFIHGNKIRVNEYNQAIGMNNIYAIGDVSAYISERWPYGHPMLAPVAIQQGKRLASNLVSELTGKPMVPFRFNDKGVMATIGRKKAVVDLPKLKLKGTIAWLIWMFVHIMSLIGFRNKVVTIIGWTINYFNYDRPLGLIIRPYRKPKS